MTVSKTGVSMSVGAGGARLTAGPRGTHVSFSKGGFYYRTRLDAPPKGGDAPQAPPVPPRTAEAFPTAAAAPPEAATSLETPEIINDTTPSAVVQAINKRIKRRNYAVLAGVVIAAGLVALSVRWPIALGVGVISMLLATLLHRRSRHSYLVYGNEEETAKRVEILQRATAALRSAESIWSVREASLDNGLTPKPPTLRRTKVVGGPPPLPIYILTNITPAALDLTDCALYFMPDRLFVWRSEQFVAIDYKDMKLRPKRVTFLERECQPPDALVEHQMRGSLSDEKTVPVLYYGLVDINAAPAFQARLMTSRPESAEEFAMLMRAITGEVESAAPAAATEEPLYTQFDDSRVPLFYDMSVEGVRQFQKVRDAFAIIVQCDCVWRNDAEKRTDDWKRNAGASTLVTRSRIYPKVVDAGPGFESNVAVGLCFGSSTLLLLPDGIATRIGDRYKLVGKTLGVHVGATSFREEEVSPRDGEVVGMTWQYVNKKGGPDLRFNNNRQIPIYRYGQVEISCGLWQVHLTLSRANAALEFAAAIRAALGEEQEGTQKERPKSHPPPDRSSGARYRRCVLALGAQARSIP
jgi:hypothetical protein